MSVETYPWHASVHGGATPVATVGAWTVAFNGGDWNTTRQSNGGVQNDSIAWDVLLSRGTWTLDLFHSASTNRGIYTVQIDDGAGNFIDVGTIDGYAAAAAPAKGQITGIVLAFSGKRRIRFKVATKNAASTGYQAIINGFTMTRTA